MARVLVIDDSPTIRKVVELTFRGTEWSVDFAASGREGIAAAINGSPDLILLDFVLPDMRGLDVAARLAESEATRGIPTVLMSAKDDTVRRHFEPYPSVVDFVRKPFTGEELLARVRTAAADDTGRPRPSRTPSRFTHANKEAAAKALYAKLSRAFAFIPSWCAQMGASAPAPFFARKMLTPEAMSELLDALVPVFREVLKNEACPAVAADDGAIRGELHGWSLSDVLTLLGVSARTGELRLERDRATWIVYFRAGEIVFVTSLDPNDHTRDQDGWLDAVPAEARARAEAEQRASGKPVPVTLAELGALPGGDVPPEVHRASKRLLLDVLDAKGLSFTWHDLPGLPSYVGAYGRYVPMARNTLMFGGPPVAAEESSEPPASLHDVALERARAVSRDAEPAWPAPEMVLDRAQGFSGRVKGLRLDAVERRVLTLVNGRSTLREIGARAMISEADVRRIAHSLGEVGLLAAPAGPRPVLLVDGDVEGFQRPLESLLARRADPVRLRNLADQDELVEAAILERPSLVILNGDAARDACGTVKNLRSHEHLARCPLVAVLELSAASRVMELTQAGFDAVLVKPVAYADLEGLIALS